MASKDKAENKENNGDEEGGGFLDKVKDFIHDVGEKIEDAVGLGKPTADVSAIQIVSVDIHRAEIVVDITVTNPNPIPIPLTDMNYIIESGGRKLVSGLVPDAGTVPADGLEIIKVPLVFIYEDIRSTYADIEPGSVIPYKIRVELIIDIPVIGNITIPMEKSGEIPVPQKPEIELERVKFGQFSLEETTAKLHLRLDNKNEFDLGVTALEYEVWLGDANVGGATLERAAEIGKKASGVVELPIAFRPKEFGAAVWEMITGRGTGYSMKGFVDVNTPFGPMRLPFSREGGSTRLQKDGEDEQ